jgi:hypothetical protein
VPDRFVCFGCSRLDFSAVSETEEKHKNQAGVVDRDRGVWDIELTRQTLTSAESLISTDETALGA